MRRPSGLKDGAFLFEIWYIKAMKNPSNDKHTRGEIHGCIVCGKPYQLYVVYDAEDRYIDCKVMSGGGRHVPDPDRPLVACEKHPDEQVRHAVERVYGKHGKED
jgi:hypothetical protein